jgi:hypothetical protein
MTQVQAIKHAERQPCRAGNLGVIGTVKKAHGLRQKEKVKR